MSADVHDDALSPNGVAFVLFVLDIKDAVEAGLQTTASGDVKRSVCCEIKHFAVLRIEFLEPREREQERDLCCAVRFGV